MTYFSDTSVRVVTIDGNTRVLVVDDHRVVREGIHRMLDADETIEFIGEAATVAEARRLVDELGPDVAIIDVVLPDGDGIQLCREIHSEYPATACIILTSHPERQAVLAAALANAVAYLPKDGGDDLAASVRMAAAGQSMLDRDTVERLIEELTSGESDSRLDKLTPQERRVFELIGHGLSNRDIGKLLHVTEKTAKNYVSRALTKLDMSRRTEAAILAVQIRERKAWLRMQGRG